MDNNWFKRSFVEAAKNAKAIRFDVTSYSTSYPEPGLTAFELQHIVNDPSLLAKTTFSRGGEEVFWNGSGFVRR